MGGCTKLTLLRQIDLPQITTEQRVRFGILCAKAVCDSPEWNAWADRWLDGSDRSVETAWEAWAAAVATADATAAEAEAAARAARAVAQATAWAAWEAARTAEAAAESTLLDLRAIAREALKGDSDE